MCVDGCDDVGLEFGDLSVDAALDLLASQFREPTLDLEQPAC